MVTGQQHPLRTLCTPSVGCSELRGVWWYVADACREASEQAYGAHWRAVLRATSYRIRDRHATAGGDAARPSCRGRLYARCKVRAHGFGQLLATVCYAPRVVLPTLCWHAALPLGGARGLPPRQFGRFARPCRHHNKLSTAGGSLQQAISGAAVITIL